MKRSEMELEIRSIVEASLEDWELPTHAIEYTASNILIIIEAMGMLPPLDKTQPYAVDDALYITEADSYYKWERE